MSDYTGQSEIRNIKRRYKNTIDKEKVISEFYEPSIKYCIIYKRAAGYFSSAIFSNWLGALSSFIDDDKKVYLLTSPFLLEEDKKILEETLSLEQQINYQVNIIERELLDFIEQEKDGKYNFSKELFKWLILKGKLEIKFGIPVHVENANIYHDKGGIFYFPNSNDKISFSGSSNESINGLYKNSEKMKVFRNWVESDLQRVLDDEEEFDEDWQNKNPGLKTISPNLDLLNKIKSRAKENPPDYNDFLNILDVNTKNKSDPILDNSDERYEFQNKFSDNFLLNKNGYFEMATGTGKTFLAMKIIEKMRISKRINSVIIAIPGNELLRQWFDENIRDEWLKTRSSHDQNEIITLEDSDAKRDHERFINYFHTDADTFSVLVCNYHNLEKILTSAAKENAINTLLIFDEVHNLTSENKIITFTEILNAFQYKLGLSATIDHKYDSKRKEFIENSIGKEIGKINLGEAISKKILSPFNYFVFPYDLNQEEKIKKQELVAKYNGSKNDPNSIYTKEQFFQDIAKINAKAVEKKEIFKNFIKKADNYKYLKNCFIYFSEQVEATEIVNFINQIPEINSRTVLGNQSGLITKTDKETLNDFKLGKLDCLIMCLKLSEGISINNLENVFMFYTDSNLRLVTQRIGRVLRLDKNNPKKIANVFDFELNRENKNAYNPDQERVDWLNSISYNKNK